MKKTLLFLLLASTHCLAQDQAIRNIADQISIDTLKKNLYYLASDQLEGRLMGTHGDTLASQLVAGWFKQHHITAPYNKENYFQPITAQRIVVDKEIIKINNKVFQRWDGWVIPKNTQSIDLKDIPVVFAGYGISDSLYNDLQNIDVKGKAVIILPSHPKANSITFKNASLSAKSAILKEKGADLIIEYDETFKEDENANRKNDNNPLYINYSAAGKPLPLLYASEERVNELLAQNKATIRSLKDSIDKALHPLSFRMQAKITIDVQISLREVHAPNVVGIIKGTDTTASCMLVTAHHDHLGRRGANIYHGARDNASGTVVLMEMAALMNTAINEGFRPKRSIVFISTTGEEGGNLGSFYYADHPLYPIEKTYADINLDLLGRPDEDYLHNPDSVNYVYVFLKENTDHIKNALEIANRSPRPLKINYDFKHIPIDIMLKGGDTYPFTLKSLPCISFFTGVDKDAVQPTDTADKINYPMLARQTQLAFLTLWNLANE